MQTQIQILKHRLKNQTRNSGWTDGWTDRRTDGTAISITHVAYECRCTIKMVK